MSGDDLHLRSVRSLEAFETFERQHADYIEAMAAAFVKEVGAREASQYELVTAREFGRGGIVQRCFFRRRDDLPEMPATGGKP